MKEEVGDLWTFPADAVVITTNGVVKANGEAVMGRGCALEAKIRFPGIATTLGRMITCRGNRVHLIGYEPAVIAFPTKHDWRDSSDPELIRKSAVELAALVNRFGYRKVAMPRPGCGNGGLEWENVKPLLEPHLDDKFTIVWR